MVRAERPAFSPPSPLPPRYGTMRGMPRQFCSEWGVFLAGVTSHPQGVIRCCCCVWPRGQGVTVELGSTSFVRHFFFFFFSHFYFPASGHAVVTSVVPFPPRFLPSFFITHSVPQSHCSSTFPSNDANARSRAFRKSVYAQEKVPTSYTSTHSAGLELTKQTYTRLEDNLIRHRGDWYSRTHETDLYQARG